MRGYIARIFCLFAIVVCFTFAAAGDAIVNGSFEIPELSGRYEYVPSGNSIYGWDVVLPGVERFEPGILGAGSAQDGKYVIDLTSDFGVGGGITQSVPTKVGGTYVLSFYGGTFFGFGRNGTGHIDVMIDGVTYPFTVVNPLPMVVWTPLTVTFVAQTANTTIAFMNFDQPNTTFSLLDNVSLEGPPPDPPDPPDVDNDGVLDTVDQCASSDVRPTVIIGSCDTGVPNTVSANGCTISDQLGECASSSRNHGQYVSCVSYVTNQLKKAGVISGSQKGAIQSCAARSGLP